MQINKVRLIHKAFEKDPVHIATYTPGLNEKGKDVHWILEDIYKSSQNAMDSWSNPDITCYENGFKYDGSRNFTMIAPLNKNPKLKDGPCKGKYMGHRSTSCGDLCQVVYKNKTDYYFCAAIGWKKITADQYNKIITIKDELELRDYFAKANLGKENIDG